MADGPGLIASPMPRALALIVCLGAATLTLIAQAPSGDVASPSPQNTLTIRGRVVEADTGNPIRNARVGVGDSPESPVELTDADGRFTLSGLPANQQDLSAAKTGYVKISAGISDGVEIRLTKSGAITGHVFDDLGEPVPLLTVVADRLVQARGLVTVERTTAAETDDLGEYRLFGLPPGEFVVAIAGGRMPTATAPVPISRDGPASHNYYPHAQTPEEAQPIPVAGGEVTGIDLTVPLPPAGSDPGTTSPPAARTRGSGAIQGRVVRADGLPLRRGSVRLTSSENLFSPDMTRTDDDGRYAFRNLRPGTYAVAAAMPGASPVAFGQRGASERGERLTLEAGAVLDRIDIMLPPGIVISGRILDEYGDPMENANVRVEQIAFSKGRRRLIGVPAISTQQTNDLGRYRMFGLSPGRYVIGVVVGESVPGRQTADWPGYARTYFPGTPSPAEAQTVDLELGQQALNIDFALVRGHVARITGTAYTADGAPLQGVMSLTQSYRSGAIATPLLSARTNMDGSFEFARLASGEYVLQAATSRANVSTEGEFASQFVTVNGMDVTGLTVRLSSGSTIEGRLTFDGADPPVDADFRLSPVPADPDLAPLIDNAPARANIHDDWTFDISGVNGPRRLQLVQAPDGWMLKAVRVNGVDVTDTPLAFGAADQSLRDVEVVLTSRVNTLTAVARDTNGGTPSDFRVVAFAIDRARRYAGSRFVAVGAPRRDAAVSLRGLPPGEYYVTALDRRVLDETAAIDDAEFLESLVAGATRVTLSDGRPATLTLSVVSR